jgi:hypothetical protein
MEVGALVKEHLFTNKRGEIVERYGVVIREETNFAGFVEVVWQPRPGHPVSVEAHQELTAVKKLVLVVPPTKVNGAR